MIYLMIGNTVGLIAASIALDYSVGAIVAYDNKDLYRELGFRVYDSMHDERFTDGLLGNTLLCVHGREIVPELILNRCRHAINVHPYFNYYKGSNPIKKAIEENNSDADVTAHEMTSKVDCGKIIVQEKIKVCGKTIQEIYSELYPVYAKVIKEAINKCILEDKNCGNVV